MSELPIKFLIDDENAGKYTDKEGQGFRGGLERRDYGKHPLGCYSGEKPFDDKFKAIIPREEWPERCADQLAQESSLYHILETGNFGNPIPSLDQNGQGFCWAYSTAGCVQAVRALAGMPFVQLSPHAVACKIYNFQDRGAWGALSMDFISRNGIPSDDFWPQKSMSRRNDNAKTWENAKQYKIVEGFVDLDVQHVADAKLTFDQVATCYLNRIPVVLDLYWWGHSVFGHTLFDRKPELGQQGLDDPNRWATGAKNSWTDKWGDRGYMLLSGSKQIPDGACAPRAVTSII